MIDRKQRRGRRPRKDEKKDEFDQQVIDLARVTRVMAGGKRMRFRACVVAGDKKGRVGMGVAKGADVSIAVNKAATKARKQIITVPLVNDTIPHEIVAKFCGAEVFLKPARVGRGVIAGGPVRAVVELAGIKNIVSKMRGSKNKVNNVTAVINALQTMRTQETANKEKDTK
ncbi:30S ribosomal protein S5 [Patescibacteria group bacterium]|nr:30S ribosomal protein S5 [Patescibacteria group bacterium]MBU1673661.1 30S ribosomal protein S5 [Patescibacteria group bacterium]MBU1963851.1 30S ribosomal protein S5 [Patescibacteria group bacterium]